MPMRRPFLASALVCLALLLPAAAGAQAFLPIGFSSLPSFAWPQAEVPERSRWEGSYARLASGFQVTASRRFGTSAGPTLGFEGGRMWREGDVVYGIAGGFDATTPFGGYGTPSFGRVGLTRDFAGALQAKAGVLLTEDVLVYAKGGLASVHETLRFGPSAVAPSFSRSDIAVRPDARVGVEWAVTDRLTLSIEAGMTGPGIR